MNYGFYDVYNIPNPCYISSDSTKEPSIDLEANTSVQVKGELHIINLNESKVSKIAVTSDKYYSGLAEFILKPRNVIGVPLECNIIWPDQVVAESFVKNYIAEPTRVLLKREALPGIHDNTVLTSDMMTGPYFKSSNDQFFRCFNTPEGKPENDESKIRRDSIYSPYEKVYGLTPHRLQLSHAFNDVLLGNDANTKDAAANVSPEDKLRLGKRVNNFLNYEFSQKYLGSRQYSIQVTPDVNPVPGIPLVVLNESGEHVIAFCLAISKSWAAGGSKHIQVQAGYPRFYYENIGDLNAAVDPTASSPESLAELCTLVGSKPLADNLVGSNMGNLKSVIDKLFIEYKNNKIVKNKYKRKNLCTLNNYIDFVGCSDGNKIDDIDATEEYPNILAVDSRQEALKLSCNYFSVYDRVNHNYTEYNPSNPDKPALRNSELITKHNEWISIAQRI